jgi:hypothetical protein
VPALSRLAVYLLLEGFFAEGRQLLARLDAIAVTTQLGPTLRARVINAHADLYLMSGDLGTFLQLEEQAAALFESADDQRNAALYLGYVAYAATRIGANDRALAVLRDVLGRSSRLGIDELATKRLPYLVIILTRFGQLDEARGIIRDYLGRPNAVNWHAFMRCLAVTLELAAGEVPAAQAHGRAALELAATLQRSDILVGVLVMNAEIALAAGDVPQACVHVASAAEVAGQIGKLEIWQVELELVRARVAWACDEHDRARGEIRALRERILTDAAKIADPRLRDGFLTGVPHHARALALADEWGA